MEKLEKQLRLFQEVLDEWLECQKNWMYLESIFSAPDIQRQLPNESKAFILVDKQFKVRRYESVKVINLRKIERFCDGSVWDALP